MISLDVDNVNSEMFIDDTFEVNRTNEPFQGVGIGAILITAFLMEQFCEILKCIKNQHLEPMTHAISSNKEAILHLQQEISTNRCLIQQLQKDSMTNKEASLALEKALAVHEDLISKLQVQVSHHDNLISELQNAMVKSNDFSQQLLRAILENKKLLGTLQNELNQVQELQDVLIKYENNPDGLSALHYAIKMGDLKAVKLMVDHGADVNARSNGVIALHQAILANQLEIISFLLDNGADVNAVDINKSQLSWKAIHYAAEVGNGEIINLLVKKGANVNADAFYNPANPNNVSQVKTPLHIAAELGQFNAVKALVAHKADINRHCSSDSLLSMANVFSPFGGTPLDFAISKLKYADNPENLDLIRFLVGHGAIRKVFNTYQDMYPCPVIRGYLKSLGQ